MEKIPIPLLDNVFSLLLATLYSGHFRKTYGWLTRVGPDGHKGRQLWIKIHEFNSWCIKVLDIQLQINVLIKEQQH